MITGFVLYLTCNNPTTQKKEHCQSKQFFASNVTEYELVDRKQSCACSWRVHQPVNIAMQWEQMQDILIKRAGNGRQCSCDYLKKKIWFQWNRTRNLFKFIWVKPPQVRNPKSEVVMSRIHLILETMYQINQEPWNFWLTITKPKCVHALLMLQMFNVFVKWLA